MKTCQGRRNYRFDVIFIIAYLFNISMTLLNGLSQLLSLPSKPTGDVQSLVRDFIFDKNRRLPLLPSNLLNARREIIFRASNNRRYWIRSHLSGVKWNEQRLQQVGIVFLPIKP
jgi:hypothetical protein